MLRLSMDVRGAYGYKHLAVPVIILTSIYRRPHAVTYSDSIHMQFRIGMQEVLRAPFILYIDGWEHHKVLKNRYGCSRGDVSSEDISKLCYCTPDALFEKIFEAAL